MMGHEGLVLYLLTVYLAIIRGFSLLFIDHKEYARFSDSSSFRFQLSIHSVGDMQFCPIKLPKLVLN